MYLKGKLYKRKVLNTDRVWGLLNFGAAFSIYVYAPYLAPVFGPTFTSIA
jgi:hypothetical protein